MGGVGWGGLTLFKWGSKWFYLFSPFGEVSGERPAREGVGDDDCSRLTTATPVFCVPSIA